MNKNDMKGKILLIDVDGTCSEDIKNEDSHLYATAKHYPEALKRLNSWYDRGAHITFFTAREEKDREVTEKWLKNKGFKFHGLIMNKPRCTNENDEYIWIDNRKVRGITYKKEWNELKKVKKEILTFGD